MNDFRNPDHNVEGCPGCRPVVFDPETGIKDEKLSEIVGKAFDRAAPVERRAWHRVTCLNSRDPIDLMFAQRIVKALDIKV